MREAVVSGAPPFIPMTAPTGAPPGAIRPSISPPSTSNTAWSPPRTIALRILLRHIPKNAIKWTRLWCRKFRDNAVRLQLHALAYNLANFMRTPALPKEVEHWSLTTLREKLVKTGAKMVSHGRYVMFQLAEVAVPRELFRKILSLIDDLRRRPVPAQAGKIDGQVKTTGGVCLNGGKSGQIAFQVRAGYQNHTISCLWI